MQFSGQSGRYLRQSEVMNFKDSTDKKTVIDRINNMRQMSGDTCIGEALDYFYRYFSFMTVVYIVFFAALKMRRLRKIQSHFFFQKYDDATSWNA